jgi:hypothetical protein
MNWRHQPKTTTIANRIPESDWPKLVAVMKLENVYCVIQPKGPCWYVNRFALQKSVIREAYGLTQGQFNRFMDYVYRSDPWGAEE